MKIDNVLVQRKILQTATNSVPQGVLNALLKNMTISVLSQPAMIFISENVTHSAAILPVRIKTR